ncbi:MAG TPA: HAD-IA family hydrolase [Candidatus Limnocylindrales bacterium]|nr:HAD-IA family hydrolase [Candidatus Limnocylindrales bacterium]
MSNSALRAIIFDIGRVLVRVDVRRVQLGLAKCKSLTPEELWSAIEKDPRWRDWQEGRMSSRDWHQNLSSRLGLSLDFEQFANVWNSALDPEPIHPDSFFERLSKFYKLGLLSNTDPIHVAHLETTYSFFRYFPKNVRTYSCSLGASKPDPLIFREALRACKVRAEQSVYVDDIAAYAEAARALGLQAIHYQSPAQLHQELLSVGIKVE